MSSETLLRHLKSRYAVTEKTISLFANQICMTIVEDPDQLLDTLSKEDQCGMLYLPYWTYLWPSAIGLARHLDWNHVPAGERVLEIGCGLGLAGIVACRTGGIVLFTDYEQDALAFTRYNTMRNGCAEGASFVQMDWNTPCFRGKFSRILGSDVIYEDAHWNPILSLLQTYLAPDGEAIFSEPTRTSASGFLERIGTYGFTYTKQVSDVVGLDGVVFKVAIYCLKWDRGKHSEGH